MEHESNIKSKIQTDIRVLAKTIHDLSLKYSEEPMMKKLQSGFLDLSVDVRRALGIPLH